MHDFIMSEKREEIEHHIIILTKRAIDIYKIALQEELRLISHLDKPLHNTPNKHYEVLVGTLAKLPNIIEHELSHLIQEIHHLMG
jgi:hypothetical protein